MSDLNSIDYKGNSIFRGQPKHSYFDKPFDDEEDCFFQLLNDIDPHFLKPQQKAECINLETMTITDPRTRKPITQLCYDYTKEEETKIYECHKKSLMTTKDHEIGVRVLNLLQHSKEVEEEDMYNWYRLQKIRLKECEFFQKFVSETCQNSKEQIYAPCRKLLELYQNWYNCKKIRLMQRYPQEAYNTHLGLPCVRQCKNALSDQQVQIINRKIVSTVGDQCYWQDNIKMEFTKFNRSISSYAEAYNYSEDVKESLEDNLQLQYMNFAEQELDECPNFYIPLESLVFLLIAGDYVDTPSDLFLNIKETENTFKKYIVMDLPLPSRQCGWHTYEQVVDHAVLAMLSLKQQKSAEAANFTQNVPSNKSVYKVLTLEEFMQKSKFTADKICKFSKTLTRWQLSNMQDVHIDIHTSLESSIQNKSVFFKMEYKPLLGCEVLTKYEILKELFKLKLLCTSETTCFRLASTNYKTLLEEPLSESKLEDYLFSVYQVNCNQLLNNLYEFLKMLYNMPLGHYMLRFNPKYKDKLMLCKPSQEITQNTIHLHELLNADVTDTEFMSQHNVLPIDGNLCSLMHLQHKILPAAFSPRVNGERPTNDNDTKTSGTASQPLEETKKHSLNTTRKKRIRKRRRQFAAFKAKRAE